MEDLAELETDREGAGAGLDACLGAGLDACLGAGLVACLRAGLVARLGAGLDACLGAGLVTRLGAGLDACLGAGLDACLEADLGGVLLVGDVALDLVAGADLASVVLVLEAGLVAEKVEATKIISTMITNANFLLAFDNILTSLSLAFKTSPDGKVNDQSAWLKFRRTTIYIIKARAFYL